MSFGRRREKTFEPSRGGIGIRLNMARRRFIFTMVYKIAVINPNPRNGEVTWRIMAVIMAIITFVRGPASETIAISFIPSLRLKGSTGTGLAAPNITGEEDNIRRSGRSMLMTGSIWLLGFRVSLPASLAVGSPKRSATYP